MAPKKVLAKVEKDNNYKYLQACLEHRQILTPLVYYVDGIPVIESLAVQWIIASYLIFKMKWGYS